MNAGQKCTWGILGAADIARKNWQAIHQSGNGILKSVASRSKERAAELIQKCEPTLTFENPVQAVEGYQAIIDDPEIQAVYLPLPTGIRDYWSMAAVEAGKHIMIEKPCSQNAGRLSEIIEAAKKKNLQVMDGVMFAHSKRFKELKQVLQQTMLGEVRRISSQFSFCTDNDWASSNIRGNAILEPFGALGDLGWYNIRLSLEAMQNQMPEQVVGKTLKSSSSLDDSEQRVPFEFEGTMYFAGGATSSFYCSFVTCLQQCVTISGTRGYLSMDDFTLPFHDRKPQFEIVASEFVTDTCDFKMIRNARSVEFEESPNSGIDAQEVNLFRDFNQCVNRGEINSTWPTASLQTQVVMDALLLSANENRPVSLQ